MTQIFNAKEIEDDFGSDISIALTPLPKFPILIRYWKADERFEVVVLDKKPCTYSYFAEPMYVFMDEEYNQYEIEQDSMGDAIKVLEEGMEVEVVFYEEGAISVELPNSIVREILYTEPAVKGDTSGKVMKPAKIGEDFEISVPAFCNIGDKIEIDTRTWEYRSRV